MHAVCTKWCACGVYALAVSAVVICTCSAASLSASVGVRSVGVWSLSAHRDGPHAALVAAALLEAVKPAGATSRRAAAGAVASARASTAALRILGANFGVRRVPPSGPGLSDLRVDR